MDTQILEIGSQACTIDSLERMLTFLCMTTAAATGLSFLALALLCEVRELVGSKQELLALCSIVMTLLVCSIYIVLNGSSLYSSQESTLFFYLQEYLPSLLSQGVSKVLNIVRTS